MKLPSIRHQSYARPLLGILLLLAALAAMLYLPVLLKPTPPAAVAHSVPLVVRHAPGPVVRHVRSLPQ
ncbi:hypothetical protein [Hymenobacter sp. APR13]|uniref:hypothetical protein n=1 Tax=Hymenobacter sp. APR13 TaxID=1356852 RepID=UPI0004E088E1|nr:hypothetical protein [Hymenobacter sp. APR13]AII54055.1 hypothetical protein N008_18975 [Hymenobacter sp. APR13]